MGMRWCVIDEMVVQGAEIYLALGNPIEALEQLSHIAPEHRSRPEYVRAKERAQRAALDFHSRLLDRAQHIAQSEASGSAGQAYERYCRTRLAAIQAELR